MTMHATFQPFQFYGNCHKQLAQVDMILERAGSENVNRKVLRVDSTIQMPMTVFRVTSVGQDSSCRFDMIQTIEKTVTGIINSRTLGCNSE